jgi:hypothetical protein
MIIPTNKFSNGKRLFRLVINGCLIAIGTYNEILQIIVEL